MSTLVSRGERWSDRFNPILVRETQQALKSRTFALALTLALVGILLVALVVAAIDDDNPFAGFRTFTLALQCFAPLILFVVPLQAFLSTRHEVNGGAAEQLLMTRLRPAAIVRGKLYAAFVQYLLFLSLFAPLFATCYLLRGIDIPTVLALLLFSLGGSLAATTLAVLLGAASGSVHLRSLPYALVAALLGGLSITVVAGADDILRETSRLVRRGNFGEVALALGLPLFAFCVFCAMSASAFLSHPYENRSTRFRLFALLLIAAAFPWLGHLAGSGVRWLPSIGSWLAVVASLFAIPFWLFAVTEDRLLSPRVRTLVPRSRLLAALSIPLLPGSARGLLYTWLLAGVTLLGAILLPRYFGYRAARGPFGIAAMCWCYAIFYAACARGLRLRFGDGHGRSPIARVIFPLIPGALSILPFFIELGIGAEVGRRWSALHIFNPVYTIAAHDRAVDQRIMLPLLACAAGVATLCHVRGIAAAIREVMTAARQRTAPTSAATCATLAKQQGAPPADATGRDG